MILPKFIDDELIDPYVAEWHDANMTPTTQRLGGWPDCTPYMRHEALRRLCCDGRLAAELERLIGEPAGVHLNLTGFVSTTRQWHQDCYLNPPHVGDSYAAVWIALDNIHTDAGPFHFVRGSHRWFEITRERIGRFVDLNDPAWPTHSERVLTQFIDEQIALRPNTGPTWWLPDKGDVLIWHSRLIHRGSYARDPDRLRPALIAHFSGIHHRSDMPPAIQHEAGGWYFPINDYVPV